MTQPIPSLTAVPRRHDGWVSIARAELTAYTGLTKSGSMWNTISGSSPNTYSLSRTGFPTRLKGNKVRIDKGKTSRVIVREKLSKRAVMKEDGLGRVYLQERRLTPIG